MNSTAQKHYLFLLYIMFLVDARSSQDGAAYSLAKQKEMSRLLRKTFPEDSPQKRQKRTKWVLSRFPKFKGGIHLLQVTEKHSQALLKAVDGDRNQTWKVVKQLKRLAESDGTISPQELVVMRTASNNLGFFRRLDIQHSGDQLAISRI
jgi:hypothetical protein